MANLVIAGATVTPSEMTVNLYDIVGDDTRRTSDGALKIEYIAAKQKIELKFNVLTATQLSTILSLFSSFFFSVVYTNPITNTARTATMYVGDRNTPHKRWVGADILYTNVKFNLIEQ